MPLLPTPINKGFEVDASGWTGSSANISRSTSQSFRGAASMFVDPTANAGAAADAVNQQAAPVTAYTMRVWVRPVGGGTMRLGFNEYTPGSVYITTQQQSFGGLTADTWQLLEHTFAVTDATCGEVQCFVARGSSESGDFYFDHVDSLPVIEGVDLFAHGDFSEPGGGPYSNVEGAPTKDVSIRRLGDPASLLISTTDSSTEYVEYQYASLPTLGWRGFFFRMNSGDEPTSNMILAQMWSDGFGSAAKMFWIVGTNEILVSVNDTDDHFITVSLDEWHWIEQIFDVTGTTHTVYTRVDGVDMTPSADGGNSATTVQYHELGFSGISKSAYRFSHAMWGTAASVTDWLGEPTGPGPVTSYQFELLEDDPLVLYPLDLGSGLLEIDLMGGPSLTREGGNFTAVPPVVPPHGGGSTRFAAQDATGTLQLADSSTVDFPGNAPFTAEAWFRPTRIDEDYRRLFSWTNESDSGTNAYFLYYQQGQIGAARRVNGTDVGIGWSTVPQVGRAYHVVLTYDGADIFLYVNGEYRSEAASAGAQGAYTGNLRVGGGQFGGGSGYMDLGMVAIYDYALTAERILAHYQAGAGLLGERYSRLAGPVELTSPSSVLCITPSDRQAEIRGLHISNPSAAAVEATLGIGDPYEYEVLTDRPVAYWRMAEPEGLIRDSSGYGNHATSQTIALAPDYFEPSQVPTDVGGRSIKFNSAGGSGSFFLVPDHDTLDVGNVFTVECWLKLDDLEGDPMRLVNKGDVGSFNTLILDDDTFVLEKGAAYFVATSTEPIPRDGKAHHLVFVRPGTNQAVLYLDGVDVTGSVTPGGDFTDNAEPLRIGSGADQHLDGWLDEIAVYDHVLTADRVMAHYLAGVSVAEGSRFLSELPIASRDRFHGRRFTNHILLPGDRITGLVEGQVVPSFVGAGAGAERLTSGSFTVSKTGCTAGNIVALDMRANGNTADWGGWANVVNIERLDGVDSQLDFLINALDRQLCFGRVIANGTVSADLTVGASGEDLAGRIYEFSAGSRGATLAAVVENGTGTNFEAGATSTSVGDADVETNGSNRLALNFVGMRSAQAIAAFTGETGGDWTEAVAEYVGTTLTLQLQIATMEDARTIGGGSATVSSTAWFTIGTALLPVAPVVVIDGYVRH